MAESTTIAKSGSDQKSSPSTRDEALARALEQISKACAEGKLSKKPLTNSVTTSKTLTIKPSSKPVTISTSEENGENPGKAYIPPHLAKLSTSKLAALDKQSSPDSDYVRTALVLRSNEGDEEAYKAIAKSYEHIYEGLTVTGRNLLKCMVKSFAGEDRRMSQIIVASDILANRDKLAGDSPSPLELVLAERVALCQAALDYLEVQFYQPATVNIHVSIVHQHRISIAQSRLVQAIKALAQVRKLQLPNVQVNIGEKQVNVA